MELSIVVPVKNEKESVEAFIKETTPFCDQVSSQYEIIFVDDGSTDGTLDALLGLHSENPRLKIVSLSRNFGKEKALTAGLDHAKGDAVIPMDVDLQDPPELIPTLYKKYQEGFDTVIAIRRARHGDKKTKKIFAKLFYNVLKHLSEAQIQENAGDFRLISKRVLKVIQGMNERTRFMKGIMSWPGFSIATVNYDRPERLHGETKWRLSNLWKLALDGIFSFSTRPLKIWTYIGFLFAATSIVFMLYTVTKTIVLGVDVPGYASLMSVVLFIGGINLMGIGIVGEYISRIFVEVKARPLYVINKVYEHVNKENTGD